MKSLKAWLWLALGIALICFGVWAYNRSRELSAIPQPSAGERAAAVRAMELHRRRLDLDLAMDACEKWTKTQSKVEVKKIVSRYEITNRPVKFKREYWVGVDFEPQGKGPLREAVCHYLTIVGSLSLVDARTAIK